MAIILGSQGGWFLAVLIPIAAASLYMVARVALTMIKEIREGRRSLEWDSEEE